MHINTTTKQGADNIFFPPDFYLLIVNKLLLFLMTSLQNDEENEYKQINKTYII